MYPHARMQEGRNDGKSGQTDRCKILQLRGATVTQQNALY